MMVSESVGCGWMVSSRSLATAAISIAKGGFRDKAAGMFPGYPCSQDPAVFRIDNQLSDAGIPSQCGSPSRSAPWKDGRPDIRPLSLCFFLGKSGPGNLRLGEYNGRNGLWLIGGFLPGNMLSGHAAFMRSLVCQEGLTGDIADGIDMLHPGPAVNIHRDKALIIGFNSGFFSPIFSVFGFSPIATSILSKVSLLFFPFLIFECGFYLSFLRL